NALNENNLVNDGDFDWVKVLQEHRSNRSKTKNTTLTGIVSSSVTTKKVINPVNGVSSTVRNNQELHNRTVAPRSICQHPLP
ncbi:unnamed protein product, partial [Rotaria magnacalcarata]